MTMAYRSLKCAFAGLAMAGLMATPGAAETGPARPPATKKDTAPEPTKRAPAPKPRAADKAPDDARAEEAAPPSRRSKRSPDPPLKDLRLQDEQLAEEQIDKALASPTEINFLETPLEDALGYLKEYHKINVWPDWPALAEAKLTPDTPVTLHLSGARLESVLNLLLDPLRLEWLIQDEVLKVTTRARAETTAETLTFDIENLLDAGHDPDELVEAIERCIAPETWRDDKAGTGYGAVTHSGGVLICRQTQRVLSAVAALLEDLDALVEKQLDQPSRPGGSVITLKVYRTQEFPADELAKALPELVAKESWKDEGVQVRAVKGALLIRQSPHVHRLIARAMKQLLPPEEEAGDQQQVERGQPADAASESSTINRTQPAKPTSP